MRCVRVRLAAVLAARRRAWLRRNHRPWHDTELTEWHAEHHDPASGVWAVRPPCGNGFWELYPPGTELGSTGFLTDPAIAQHPAGDQYGGDNDRVELADVREWMARWVERVSGGRVVDMVEGWSEPYGTGRWREYVIYARVGGTR